ncbi:MAG: DUF2179 domain-containing protein [Clostridiales bacterium]|nr:DUF2179 domain-containing protein [Clostridiales bacterium]
MEIIQEIAASPTFRWVILPLLIFLGRICDVTLGTLRIIFVSRSKRILAPIVGFFEVSIWLLAISQIMQQLDNPLCFIAYAGGFAMGNYIGIRIEEKLAMGSLVVRVFLTQDDGCLKERLAEAGFGYTSIPGQGKNGAVEIIFTVIMRKDLEKVIQLIESCREGAFYSVEDVKMVRQGIFPKPPVKRRWEFLSGLKRK